MDLIYLNIQSFIYSINNYYLVKFKLNYIHHNYTALKVCHSKSYRSHATKCIFEQDSLKSNIKISRD